MCVFCIIIFLFYLEIGFLKGSYPNMRGVSIM
jgi:hypothetical protein